MQVVAPVFNYLAVQVAELGEKGFEASDRVTYDDCDESFCRRDVVKKLLKELGMVRDKRGRLSFEADPFDALVSKGLVSL